MGALSSDACLPFLLLALFSLLVRWVPASFLQQLPVLLYQYQTLKIPPYHPPVQLTSKGSSPRSLQGCSIVSLGCLWRYIFLLSSEGSATFVLKEFRPLSAPQGCDLFSAPTLCTKPDFYLHSCCVLATVPTDCTGGGFSQSFSPIWGFKIAPQEVCIHPSWSTAISLSKPWVAWCPNPTKGTSITNTHLAQTSDIGHEFL